MVLSKLSSLLSNQYKQICIFHFLRAVPHSNFYPVIGESISVITKIMFSPCLSALPVLSLEVHGT